MNIFIAEVTGQHAELRQDESWHCARVLRKRPGDKIRLIDARGNFYEAVLDLVSEKKCSARVTHGPIPEERSLVHLHLAVAPTKQLDRTEWMLEKAVEIGVQEISFFYSEHSERNVIKPERVSKIVESAVKQSLRASIPKLNEITTLKQFLKKQNGDSHYIAYCSEGQKQSLARLDFLKAPLTVLIGPEGDFSEVEVRMALEAGYKGLDLGAQRLRSETAGLVVCMAAALQAGK